MPHRKNRKFKPTKLIRGLLFDKRAVSVALTTMMITGGVLAAGIFVLYWAYSWGNVANNQYFLTVSNAQNSTQENLSFEYLSTANNQLTIYVINSGLCDDMNFSRLYIWNDANQLIGYYNNTQFQFFDINNGTPITSLNKGDEGKLVVPSVTFGSGYYTIRAVTGRGRNFDTTFSV